MFVRTAFTLVLMINLLSGQTLVSGSVSGVWDSRNSPYQLSGNVLVEAGATLIIESGVQVDMGSVYELRIQGSLVADGVNFHNGGSLFGDAGEMLLDNCDFINLSPGISVYSGSARLNHCLIDGAGETGITFSGSDSSYVRDSQVINSGDYGIKIRQTDVVEISGNVLTGNSTNDFSHPALFIDSCSPQVVEQNIIEDNHAQGIGIWTLTATAAPIIRNNLVRRNFTGITIVNSPPLIEGNIIVANFQEGNSNSGAGIYAGYPSAQGILVKNYIAGNYFGISNITNATLNLGDLVNDFPGDDGENIFFDNSYEGDTWNIWNGTTTPLMAQNNYWPELLPADIDETLWE